MVPIATMHKIPSEDYLETSNATYMAIGNMRVLEAEYDIINIKDSVSHPFPKPEPCQYQKIGTVTQGGGQGQRSVIWAVV